MTTISVLFRVLLFAANSNAQLVRPAPVQATRNATVFSKPDQAVDAPPIYPPGIYSAPQTTPE